MRKITLILLAVLFLSTIAYLLPTRLAHAQTLPAGFTDTVTVTPATSGYYVSSLGKVITSAIKWIAYVSGIVLIVYLVWGGVEWMTAGGDKAKVEAGRTKITQTIIGFAILAVIFVGYAAVLDFLGLRSKVGIGNIGQGGGAVVQPGTGGTNPGTGGTNPGTGSTCTTATLGQTFNDGGAGGYCTGSAMVKCEPAGVGGLNFPHFEPCSCISGQKAWNWQTCP